MVLGLGLGCLQDCRKWAGNGLVPKGLSSTQIQTPSLGHFQVGSYCYRSLIEGLYIPYRSLIEALNTPNSPPVVSFY